MSAAIPTRTRALRPPLLLAVLALGLALGALLTPPARASFGVHGIEMTAENENAGADTQAGSHPYALTVAMTLNRKPLTQLQREGGLGDPGPYGEEIAEGSIKDLEATLPAGMMVDLLGVPRCSEQLLARQACSAASQVGVVSLDSPFGLLYALGRNNPVFNIAPSSPRIAGAIGFTVGGVGFIAHLIGSDHAGGDYGISALVPGIPQVADADGLVLTLWGQPSAPTHCHQTLTGGPCIAVPEVREAFLTMPTSCPQQATPGEVSEASMSATADSWQEPGSWTPLTYSPPLPPRGGCEHLSFTPSIDVAPETAALDQPTGVSIVMKLPQNESSGSLAESALREALITLPSGLAISPSAVNGLGACSEAQIALHSPAPPSCPEDSKVGTAEAHTPLLDHPVYGSVYLAQQGNGGPAQGSNPFGSMVAMYIVIEGSGVQIKLAGQVSLDQATGQLTARFAELPQVPYGTMTLHFFGGPRAALVPVGCGTLTTTTMLTPWSAPQSGPPATPQSSFQIGSDCADRAFAPGLLAGTTSNQAGGFSPVVEVVSRGDGEQEFTAAREVLPEGMLAYISHVTPCSEPRAREGTCGPESQVGHVTVAVGPGPDPLQVSGLVYLTGPYHGAPFGADIVVPARGGPFDLGNVVVRLAINVDPTTAQGIATAIGPIPRMFAGVPLQIKHVTIAIDRPGFLFNPTSCRRRSFSASIAGSQGTVAPEQVPFQTSGCAGLEFKPKLTVRASARSPRQDGVSVDVRLAVPSGSGGPAAASGGQANFSSVRVQLPQQLPARLVTIQKACLASVFEANPAACPPESIVAVVRAHTTLLPVEVTGPAYFVSFGNARFPELVIVLQGDGVVAQLHGETFISKHGVTTATFAHVPDVPVSSFELYLPEGPHSALTTLGSLCNKRNMHLPAQFVAQNGAEVHESVRVAIAGCGRNAVAGSRHTKHARRHPRAHRSSAPAPTAPIAATAPASAVSETGVTLSGTVQRGGAATSYGFQYGTSAVYGTTIAGTLPSTAPETAAVTLALDNLAPSTTYHFRLVATNAAGTGLGADESFTTPGPDVTLSAPPTAPLVPMPDVTFPAESAPEPPASPGPPRAKAKHVRKKRRPGRRGRGRSRTRRR